MRLGEREPGIYLRDVLEDQWKLMRLKYKDSLGKKKFKKVKAMTIVLESGAEMTITHQGGSMYVNSGVGRLFVIPGAANALELTVIPLGDF